MLKCFKKKLLKLKLLKIGTSFLIASPVAMVTAQETPNTNNSSLNPTNTNAPEMPMSPNKVVKIDSKIPILIDFTYNPWNKNPKTPDTAILLVRNSQNGKMVQVTLTESDANSNYFVGQYFFNWDLEGSFQADIYSPPQKAAKRKETVALESMIREGVLLRKPYFLRKEKGTQRLSLFNSAEQALEAYTRYRENALVGTRITKPTPIVDQAALESARSAAIAAEQARLAKIAADQELERERQELEARRKQEELKQQQQALAESERIQRVGKAKSLAQEAITLYQNKKFPEAEIKFRSSIELDPKETSYYFQYGATLFKNQKYNEALIAFGLSNGSEVNPREKAFFEGLCHMKLNEFDSAIQKFSSVTTVTDDSLTPSASFFMGVIYFSQENYTLSKTSFEKTLDTSKDPQLDEQAENYIEQIANIEQFRAKLAQRFTTTVTSGLMYDSNILLVSNSSSSTATDMSGFRGILNAELEYRMIYTESHELHAELAYSDMYSMNQSLQAKAALQTADPLLWTLKIPYKWKGQFFGKAYLLSMTPGLETLFLNADGTGAREYSMGTTSLSTEQTFVVQEDYFTTVKLDWRGEDSKIESSGTSDAKKISLGNNNILFLDSKKTKAALINWNYLMNQSESNDNAFNKIELSGGYLTPVFQKSSWVNTLTLAQSSYSKSTTPRKDTNMNLSSSLSFPASESFQGFLAVGYETNTSTVEASTYKKYTVSTTFNWSLDF